MQQGPQAPSETEELTLLPPLPKAFDYLWHHELPPWQLCFQWVMSYLESTTVPSPPRMAQLMSKFMSCHDAAHVKDHQFHIRTRYSYNTHKDSWRPQIMSEHEKHIHFPVADFLMLPFLLNVSLSQELNSCFIKLLLCYRDKDTATE